MADLDNFDNTISSNIVGLSYAEEKQPGVLPDNPIWYKLEPNSFSDFGADLTTITRNTISAGRQRKKGVVSDLNVSGGYNTDLTQTNFQDMLQGFLFADAREEANSKATGVNGSSNYNLTSTSGIKANDLVFFSGFLEDSNNGIKMVISVDSATSLTIKGNTVAELQNANATCVVVGHVLQGTIDVVVEVGSRPKLTSDTLDFSSYNLIPGMWIHIGDRNTNTKFTNAANNGFKRIIAVGTDGSNKHYIIFDKSDDVMVAESNSSDKIRIIVGKIIRNEVGNLVRKRTYQLERTLGNPDRSNPNKPQAEYIIGAVPSELNITIPQAEKIAMDLSFVATDAQSINTTEDIKLGTRPVIKESSAFNTSSDMQRINLSIYTPETANHESLFKFISDFSLNINNSIQALKAIGILGAFDTSEGTFAVSGSMTAYFATVDAVKAIRQNLDVTFDTLIMQNNSGILIDIPLLTLGDGKLNIEKDQSIDIPLSFEASSGISLSGDLDYTIQFTFFDYLPNMK